MATKKAVTKKAAPVKKAEKPKRPRTPRAPKEKAVPAAANNSERLMQGQQPNHIYDEGEE